MDDGLKYITELGWGYRSGRVLQVVNNLNVFTLLTGKSMDAEQLAGLCNAKVDMLEKLLIACSAMGLLTREAGNYCNSELADQYLVRGKQLYQGDIIAHAANVWDYWSELENNIRLEPSKVSEAENHHNFIMGMYNITMGGRGKLFVDSIDLSGRKKMFDVGGGPGTFSILACRKYPELSAVVFDMPETIAIAREVVSNEGLEGRIDFVEGSWDDDDFGNGNDVVLFSNVLHGAISNASMKLGKAFDSMEPGGLVVIQEFLMNDAKTGPVLPALFNVMVGAYSEAELLGVIADAGFVDAAIVASDPEMGSAWVTAVKPY